MPRRKQSDQIAADLGTLAGKPLTRREKDVVQAILAGCTTYSSAIARLTLTSGASTLSRGRLTWPTWC
jgi:hypothetical protein